jgi:hypothetical protein
MPALFGWLPVREAYCAKVQISTCKSPPKEAVAVAT